jgi:hypothetical protein
VEHSVYGVEELRKAGHSVKQAGSIHGLYGSESQKTEIVVNATARTSDLT